MAEFQVTASALKEKAELLRQLDVYKRQVQYVSGVAAGLLLGAIHIL